MKCGVLCMMVSCFRDGALCRMSRIMCVPSAGKHADRTKFGVQVRFITAVVIQENNLDWRMRLSAEIVSQCVGRSMNAGELILSKRLLAT
jgi:hypothetical protein